MMPSKCIILTVSRRFVFGNKQSSLWLTQHGRFCALQARLFSATTPPLPPSSKTNPPLPSTTNNARPSLSSTETTDDNNNNNNHPDMVQDLAQRGKSIMNAFFHETSKRSQRRQARRRAAARRRRGAIEQQPEEEKEEEWVDDRTVREILFPEPMDVMPQTKKEREKRRAKRTWRDYVNAAKKTWEFYRWTWQGFWKSGIIVVDPNDKGPEQFFQDGKTETKDSAKADEANKVPAVIPEKKDEANDVDNTQDDNNEAKLITPTEAKQRIRRNVRRNTKVLRKTAMSLRDQVQEHTGIHTAEDFRRVAAVIMKLVSDSLQEFLSGYREGRDGQVREMLEEDLRQQQKEQEKAARGGIDESSEKRKRRRRIRRRILRQSPI